MGAKARRSRTRSAASSQSPQPDNTVFFIDRSFSGVLMAAALRAEGWQVVLHQDLFPERDYTPEEGDAYWIKEVSRRGWIILTRDHVILSRPEERNVSLQYGARILIPDKKKGKMQDWVRCFVLGRDKIFRFLERAEVPFLARVVLEEKQYTTESSIEVVRSRKTIERQQRLVDWTIPDPIPPESCPPAVGGTAPDSPPAASPSAPEDPAAAPPAAEPRL